MYSADSRLGWIVLKILSTAVTSPSPNDIDGYAEHLTEALTDIANEFTPSRQRHLTGTGKDWWKNECA